MNTPKNKVWIGLVGVYPTMENKLIAQNECAYTNVLIIAQSKKDYIIKVNEFLSKNYFNVFEFEDIEQYEKKLIKYEIDESIKHLSELVKNTKQPQFSTLHVFDKT